MTSKTHQIGDQIRNQVWNHAQAQVLHQIWNQVGIKVRCHVTNLVEHQAMSQASWGPVWIQVQDQVWNQVGNLGTQLERNIFNQIQDQFGEIT